MKTSDFVNIGKINKINRKTGEVTVVLGSNAPEVNEESEVLFIEIDGGLVPFFIAEFNSSAIDHIRVSIQDYEKPESAQRFLGLEVFILATKLQPNDRLHQYYSEIMGFRVSDKKHGIIGKIEDVIESPEQIILQIFDGKSEILVPFVEAFFVSIDNKDEILHLDLPDGLIDLYLA